MIKHLSIKNYAIIESIEIAFDTGLNIITGETGAGKSILMGALNLVLGKRADTKVLFNKDKKCIIEATFDVSEYDFTRFFEQNDLDYDAELLIRREISSNGKSRVFINDTPTTLSLLSELSGQLIDMHKQHDSLELHQSKFQLDIVDIISKSSKEVDSYHQEYGRLTTQRKALKDLQAEYATAKQSYDFNQFQYKELEEAQLVPGELDKLETTISRLENVERIQTEIAATEAILDDEQYGILTTINNLIKRLNSVSDLDKDLEKAKIQSINIQEELKDVQALISAVGDKLEDDPEQLQELQQRQDILNKLFTKHNVQSEDQLLSLRDTFGGDVEQFGKMEGDIETLKSKISQAESSLKTQAKKITKKRAGVTSKIEKNVKATLTELGMKNATLRIDIDTQEELGPYGQDTINFMFSANKGGEFAPLRKVASGGETSRLNLAIKSLVADKANLPTLVFDEIDTGISGAVALKMGHILAKMADQHQILCITHSPQVASRGDKHFHIYKEDDKDKTRTKMNILDQKHRELEIAKMLSGDPPSKSAISNAKELLG